MNSVKLKLIRLTDKQNFYIGDYGNQDTLGRVLFSGRRHNCYLNKIRNQLSNSHNDFGWAIDLEDENEDSAVRNLKLSNFEYNCPKYFVKLDINIDDIELVINEPTEILIFKSDNRNRYKIIKGYNIVFKTDKSRDCDSNCNLYSYFLTEQAHNKLIKKLGL